MKTHTLYNYTLLLATKIVVALNIYTSSAQNPIPAVANNKRILLLNGTAHLGNGNKIENSYIIIDKDRIADIGDATTVKLNMTEFGEVIQCAGKQIYPGFIAPNSTLGLTEIEAVRATNDYHEVGSYNSNIRSVIAYFTDSKVIPTVRSNGVLMSQVTPRGGIISGSSSVVQHDAWNYEDAIVKADDGIHLNWFKIQAPSFYYEDGWPGPIEKNKNYNKQVEQLNTFFKEAQAYNKATKPSVENLRFKAMKGVFENSQNLYIHADNAKEIIDAVAFAKQFSIQKIVVVASSQLHLITDFLKENKIKCMIDRVHSLPPSTDQDLTFAYDMATKLYNAGVEFCIQNQGDMEAMGERNLPFHAGTCVAYGLPYEIAVASISGFTAKILGIDSQCGTLEKGKHATLFVSEGDALDMKTNNVSKAYIQGRDIQIENNQTHLYKKYMNKYGLK
jgi:imidazolonepropionase-like amidohydrolase